MSRRVPLREDDPAGGLLQGAAFPAAEVPTRLHPSRRAFALFLGFWLLSAFWAAPAGAVSPDAPLFRQVAPGGTPPAGGAAEGAVPLPEEEPQPLPGFFSTFVRLILALALTVGLIYLTVYGLKLLFERRGMGGSEGDGKPLRVLATVFLAPRKSLHLVEVGRRILVVGAGQEEVRVLDVVTDPKEVEELREAAPRGFAGILRRNLKIQAAGEAEAEAQALVREGRRTLGSYLDSVRKLRRKAESPPSGRERERE